MRTFSCTNTNCGNKFTLSAATKMGMKCQCGGDIRVASPDPAGDVAGAQSPTQPPSVSSSSDTYSSTLHSESLRAEARSSAGVGDNGNPGGGSGISQMPLGAGLREIVLPPTNMVEGPSVDQFMATLEAPVCLEIAAQQGARHLLIRAKTDTLDYLEGKVATVWPRSQMLYRQGDPVHPNGGSSRLRQKSVLLTLSEEPYLPLRTWEKFGTGDPMTNTLGAMLDLSGEDRIRVQYVITDAGTPDWLVEAQRRTKMEDNKGFRSSSGGAFYDQTVVVKSPVIENIRFGRGMFFSSIALLLLLGGLMLVLGQFVSGLICSSIGLALIPVFLKMQSKFDPWDKADIELVKEKVNSQDRFFKVLIVVTASAETESRSDDLVRRMVQSLSQHSLMGGNSFSVLDLSSPPPLWALEDNSFNQVLEKLGCWLGNRELAGLWHLPIADGDDMGGMLVNSANLRPPDPRDVAGVYQIGEGQTAGSRAIPVNLSKVTATTNTFLIGGTGSGKSVLMEHLARAGIMHAEEPTAFVIVDPHGDFADHLLGSMPPEHADRVVIYDVNDSEYSIPYNLLDVHNYHRNPDQAAQFMIDIGMALWTDFWGPRMQEPLKRGIQLLAAANEQRAPDDQLGLSLLNRILRVSPEVRKRFIGIELDGSPYLNLMRIYFHGEYDIMQPSFREQVVQPVVSKGGRFMENPMLHLFSSPKSALNIQDIIENHKILIVTTRKSTWGSELSSFIGSVICNIAIREVTRQGELEGKKRVPISFIVDEFQTFAGVDWSEFIGELRKYGGRLVVGTQNLAKMREIEESLPEIILSGISNLFVFTVNGDDAQYFSEKELSHEDGGPTNHNLVALPEHWCYARIKRPGIEGERVQQKKATRPFAFHTRAPAPYDPDIAKYMMDRRGEYSLPYEEVFRAASEKMNYLDQYGSELFGEDARGGSKKASNSPGEKMDEMRALVQNQGSSDSGADFSKFEDDEEEEDGTDSQGAPIPSSPTLEEVEADLDTEDFDAWIAGAQDQWSTLMGEVGSDGDMGEVGSEGDDEPGSFDD